MVENGHGGRGSGGGGGGILSKSLRFFVGKSIMRREIWSENSVTAPKKLFQSDQEWYGSKVTAKVLFSDLSFAILVKTKGERERKGEGETDKVGR